MAGNESKPFLEIAMTIGGVDDSGVVRIIMESLMCISNTMPASPEKERLDRRIAMLREVLKKEEINAQYQGD